MSMFERFTDRARRVLVLAHDEARMMNHNYIGTEHLLLGLIHEGEGVAAQALESLGISLVTVRQQVEGIIGRGQQTPTGHIPFTPRAKTVLELSQPVAFSLDHNHLGTEHILLGLIREGKGVGAQVLLKLGIDLKQLDIRLRTSLEYDEVTVQRMLTYAELNEKEARRRDEAAAKLQEEADELRQYGARLRNLVAARLSSLPVR